VAIRAKSFKLRDSSVPLRAITMLAMRRSMVPMRGCAALKWWKQSEANVSHSNTCQFADVLTKDWNWW
jgi:hypothetical protein